MRPSRRSSFAFALLALLPLGAAATVEPRALVLLRVEGPDGDPLPWSWGRCFVRVDGDAFDVRNIHVAARDGLGTVDDRPCTWALRIGWPVHRTVLSMRAGKTVGLAAFDQVHGIVEEVLESAPASGGASWSVRGVTLRLPEARDPAWVTFDVTEPVAGDAGDEDEPYFPERDYDLHAPQTGLEVATVWASGARSRTVALPAGSYVLQVSTAPFVFCGNHPPVAHEYIDVMRPFQVVPNEALTVQHTLERGGWIALSATVNGHEAFTAENAPRLSRCFDSGVEDSAFETEAAWVAATASEPEATHGADLLLHVTARLTPSAGGAELTPSFTSPGRQMMGGRRHAVLGARAEMLEQLPPGEYVLSLEGPRVAPWTTTITLRQGACTEVEVSLDARGPCPRPSGP